jgi:predicted cupin superfamily sugar epimerase
MSNHQLRSPAYWIEKLQLQEHIEGGAFKEVYRSEMVIPQAVLSEDFKGNRNAGTSIYFLLQQGQFSALHKIASDEIWHFYYGDPLIVYEITTSGELIEHTLGANFEAGERFQCVVKAGSWFGAQPAPGSSYSLVGCTVAPGFDFADFELAQKESLLLQYPRLSSVIRMLCK